MKSLFNKCKLLIPFIILAAFSTLPNLILINTIDYQVDKTSYIICDYNKPSFVDTIHNPYINVQKQYDSEKSIYFDKLYSEFERSNLTESIRQQISNDTKVKNTDFLTDIKIQYQTTYSIEEEENEYKSHYLDNFFATAYYPPSFLGKTRYLSTRFSCDTFIFISDTLADKLLDYYGLPSKNYDLLITEEKYAVIEIQYEEGKTIKMCINNIMHSDENYFQKRLTYIHGDFGFAWINDKIKSLFNYELEIDFKMSPYSISDVIKAIGKYGYINENRDVTIKTRDIVSDKFVTNNASTNNLYTINFANNDALHYIVYVFLLIIGVVAFVFSLKFLHTNKIFNIAMLILIFVSIIVLTILYCLVYFYIFWSCSFALLAITYLIVNWKEVKDVFSNKKFYKVLFRRKNYEEIEI